MWHKFMWLSTSSNIPEETEKNYENLSQGTRSPGRDINPAAPNLPRPSITHVSLISAHKHLCD